MTTKNKLELLEIDEWEIKAWITRLGSMPIKVIDRCDRSAPFSITRNEKCFRSHVYNFKIRGRQICNNR